LASLAAEIQSLRSANEGMPAWLAKETLYVKKVAGARRGRPTSRNNVEEDEEDADGELEAEAVAGN
jgi:hypothetical protein